MKRKSIFKGIAMAMLASVAMQAQAVPAQLFWQEMTQPDGSTITVTLQGDEFGHYYVTPEGNYVTLCDDGYFRYTVLNEQNQLIASEIKASDNTNARAIAQNHEAIAQRYMEINSANRAMRLPRIEASQAPMRKVARQMAPAEKDVRGLIILAEFKDEAFVTSSELIEQMMNEENFTDSYGTIGSARDYFIAQSYGAFNPKFDIVGPVTLENNMEYYGGNINGSDKNPAQMVVDACEIASEKGLINMSDYDLNEDGIADLVFIIYAGYAEAAGASANCIWPHAWYVKQGAGMNVVIDGVQIDAYACSSELNGISGTQPSGIGAFCHEYSHTLGLPDLYDISGGGAMGMYTWSVMDQGCYGKNGYVPVSYSAFEREQCGWLTINELTEAKSLTIPDLNSDKTAAYKIMSSNQNQFITIETRTRKGWDAALPGEGLMITAIDYNKSIWYNNAPNDDPNRQRVKLIPADNRWDLRSLYGDLYPYNGVNAVTETTQPPMKVHNTVIKEKPLTDITYNNGVATANFMGGSNEVLNEPVAIEATDITARGFTAKWEPVADAVSYMLNVERLEEPVIPQYVVNETFDRVKGNRTVDIKDILNDYTDLPGWTGESIFRADGAIRLGDATKGGSLSSPKFNVEKEFILKIDMALFNDDSATGSVKITVENTETKELSVDVSKLTKEYSTVSFDCDFGANNTSIQIVTDKSFYFDNIRIENKNVETEESSMRYVAAIDSNLVACETYTFTALTETQFRVTEVENPVSAGIYRYKVKAVGNSTTSEWSNEITLEAKDPASVENSVLENNYIYATGNTIYVEGDAAQEVAVYNILGHVVGTFTTVEGTTSFTPQVAGIYIVRCGEQVSKVVVR